MSRPDKTLALIEALFGSLPDGVGLSDAQGHLIYLNAAGARILELDQGRWQGASVCDLMCGRLCDAAGVNSRDGCALRKPGPESGVSFQGKYGPLPSYQWHDFRIQKTQRSADMRVRCMRLEDGVLGPPGEKHLILMEDVSAEKALEREKEEWRNMVAHDLKTPLSIIAGNLHLLNEALGAECLGSDVRRLVAAGLRACGRMTELVSLYLDISRLAAGRMPIELGAVDLSASAREQVDLLSGLARERKIELITELPKELGVMADADLLSRVIDNILDNALKYTGEGGKVWIGAKALGDGRVELWIKDTGFGIPAAEQERVFDLFYQSERRRQLKIQGTGLGLTFCREALRAMGGEIALSSSVGLGSTFTVRLPAASRALTEIPHEPAG